MTNHLKNEKSPYLKQHENNPVNWFAWNKKTLIKAKNEKKPIIMVEQNAKKGLEFADIGYVLVSGQTAIAGKGDDLLKNPDVGRLFLGG